MGSRRSGLKRAIEKLFIRTIGKTTNETRSLLYSSLLAVYFSTYKNCEKKMRCRIRRLWIFHLNRPLMYASTNNKSLLHERLVRLFINREKTRERYTIWIARYIMSLVQFQLCSAWTLLVIFAFGKTLDEFTWHGTSLCLLLGGWQFFLFYVLAPMNF
jgi:hypothetical protein